MLSTSLSTYILLVIINNLHIMPIISLRTFSGGVQLLEKKSVLKVLTVTMLALDNLNLFQAMFSRRVVSAIGKN